MMEFMITRTSLHNNEQPYEGAYQKAVLWINRFYNWSISTKASQDHWSRSGTNHRLVDDVAIRNEEKTKWFITVNSIEELITLHIQIGEDLIISTDDDYEPPQPSIEIYDAYRE